VYYNETPGYIMEKKQDNLYKKKRDRHNYFVWIQENNKLFRHERKTYLNYALKKTSQKNTLGQKTTQSVSCNFFDDKQ